MSSCLNCLPSSPSVAPPKNFLSTAAFLLSPLPHSLLETAPSPLASSDSKTVFNCARPSSPRSAATSGLRATFSCSAESGRFDGGAGPGAGAGVGAAAGAGAGAGVGATPAPSSISAHVRASEPSASSCLNCLPSSPRVAPPKNFLSTAAFLLRPLPHSFDDTAPSPLASRASNTFLSCARPSSPRSAATNGLRATFSCSAESGRFNGGAGPGVGVGAGAGAGVGAGRACAAAGAGAGADGASGDGATAFSGVGGSASAGDAGESGAGGKGSSPSAFFLGLPVAAGLPRLGSDVEAPRLRGALEAWAVGGPYARRTCFAVWAAEESFDSDDASRV